MKEFAERLKLYQVQKGITQGQLAELAGVTQSTISAYMRDAKNPTLDMLAEIAKKLGVPIGWLCGENTTAPKIKTYADAMRAVAGIGNAFPRTSIYEQCNKNSYQGVIVFNSPIMNKFIDDYDKVRNIEKHVSDLPEHFVENWVDSTCSKWEENIIDPDEKFDIFETIDEELPF